MKSIKKKTPKHKTKTKKKLIFKPIHALAWSIPVILLAAYLFHKKKILKLDSSNKGFQMLKKTGWIEGTPLGDNGKPFYFDNNGKDTRLIDPIDTSHNIRTDKRGLGFKNKNSHSNKDLNRFVKGPFLPGSNT